MLRASNWTKSPLHSRWDVRVKGIPHYRSHFVTYTLNLLDSLVDFRTCLVLMGSDMCLCSKTFFLNSKLTKATLHLNSIKSNAFCNPCILCSHSAGRMFNTLILGAYNWTFVKKNTNRPVCYVYFWLFLNKMCKIGSFPNKLTPVAYMYYYFYICHHKFNTICIYMFF